MSAPGIQWWNSSYCGDHHPACLVAAVVPEGLAVRDSTVAAGPVLVVRPAQRRRFLRAPEEGLGGN
ncbi:DUF397 domain-containing protein [Streptomyces sp. NPDC049954]|uniref:DUF397 domain-containing protein n=1 Tax=Streptomyces sp. NPDC049954 TaxID=3155779 RepID=UPI003438592A